MVHRRSAFRIAAGLGAAIYGVVCIISVAGGVQKEEMVEMDLSEGGGRDVLSLIPFDELSGEEGLRVRQIIEDHTLFIDVKRNTFRSDMRTYEFLFERLPFASKVLKSLGIRNYTIKSKGGNRFEADDGSHIKGEFETLHHSEGKRIYFGWGGYKVFLLPRVNGSALFILLYREVQEGGSVAMENEMYGYLDVNNAVLGFMLKFFNVAFPTVVRNKLNEVFSTGRRVAELITEDPEKVYDAIKDDESFTPQELEDYRALFLSDHRQEQGAAGGARLHSFIPEPI